MIFRMKTTALLPNPVLDIDPNFRHWRGHNECELYMYQWIGDKLFCVHVHVAFFVTARRSNLIDLCVYGRIGPIVGRNRNSIVEG